MAKVQGVYTYVELVQPRLRETPHLPLVEHVEMGLHGDHGDPLYSLGALHQLRQLGVGAGVTHAVYVHLHVVGLLEPHHLLTFEGL